MQVPTRAILSPCQDYSACLQNIKHEPLKLLELKQQTEVRDQHPLQIRHPWDTDHDIPS